MTGLEGLMVTVVRARVDLVDLLLEGKVALQLFVETTSGGIINLRVFSNFLSKAIISLFFSDTCLSSASIFSFIALISLSTGLMGRSWL